MKREYDKNNQLRVEAQHEPDPVRCLRALLIALDLDLDSEENDEPDLSSDLLC